MRERGDGLVFSVSSIAGKRAYPLAGMAYAASKFGVSGIASAITAEEADSGVRITSIYPGEVNTPILDERPRPPSPDESESPHGPPLRTSPPSSSPSRNSRKHVVVPELVIKPTYQEFI